MRPFPYSIKTLNNTFNGEMYTETGAYAGSSIETTTTTTQRGNGPKNTKTSHRTTIKVRLPSGKIRSVVAKGQRYIPSTLITLFYAPKGDEMIPHHYMVHSNNECYKLSDTDSNKAAVAVMGWGALRHLWSYLVDGLNILLAGILSLALAVWTNTSWDWGGLAIITFVISLVLTTMLLTVPFKFIGGGVFLKNSLGIEFASCCHKRGEELIKEYDALRANQTTNQNNNMVVGDVMGGGIGDAGQTAADESSSSADTGFKPMF